jgi:hypothetical protein
MDNTENKGASAPPAEERVQRVEEAAVSGNPVEGNPSAGNMATQAQTDSAEHAQGDSATPLETGVRQRGDAERQWAAEAKGACEVAWPNSTRKGGRSVSETPRRSMNA